jgi:hypothetical protein
VWRDRAESAAMCSASLALDSSPELQPPTHAEEGATDQGHRPPGRSHPFHLRGPETHS